MVVEGHAPKRSSPREVEVGITSLQRAAPGDRYCEMMSRHLGATVVRALTDDDVTEIYVNIDGEVRFDTRSQGRAKSGEYIGAHRVEMFLNAVASSLGVTLCAQNASLEAELPIAEFRGSRLQGFVAPITAAPTFNIRKPASAIYSLDEYVTSGVISEAHRAELRRAVLGHSNIVIAGGTNSGKTTLANAVLLEVTELFPRERIVVLEDTVELQCAARDHLSLRTGPGVSLTQLVRSALRTSPNRIVVGEVRGPEALDLLDAWATGHPGGVSTVHASSAEGALLRLDRLAQRANVPSQKYLIAEAIDTVIVIQGGNGGRRVTDLATVEGIDANGTLLVRHSPNNLEQTGAYT